MQNKIQAVYHRTLNEVKRMIILASPERILLDFEGVAVNAFKSAFPSACYFRLAKSVMRNVNEIG